MSLVSYKNTKPGPFSSRLRRHLHILQRMKGNVLRDRVRRGVWQSAQRIVVSAFGGGVAIALGSLVVATGALAFSNTFSVELPRYLGKWYEYARTPNEFEDNTLTRGGKNFGPCFAAKTTYRADGDNAINLKNSCERRASDGSTITDSITGSVVLRARTQGRKLQIAFGTGVAQFFQRIISGGGFDYWIYCIGPVNENGLYDWAVVSGPKKDYIFVLTRTREITKDVRSTILRCSAEQGLPIDKLIYRQGDAQS